MSRTHFIFLLGVIYICLASIYLFNPFRLIAPPPTGDLSAFTRGLDTRIPRFLQSVHVPGVSIALIQHGQVVWANGYGYGLADVQQRSPVTEQTIFQAASVSRRVS